jgi:NAD(P)-dependent dehydrogenase (short-subunit alcohol dehydrogenase family)
VSGAGRGIGEAIARGLAAAGYRVVVADVDGSAAERVAATVRGRPAVVDVSDEQSVNRLWQGLDEPPDLLVNNAGIVRFGPLLELSCADFRRAVEVNLTGTFLMARACARLVAASGDRRRRTIINIGSMNGAVAGPNAGAYGASKAAVALLTQQMALEWAPLGLRVNCVAPGLIDGGMAEPIYADAGVRRAREEKVPLGRLGTPDDVAQAVLLLASPGADYITGQVLLVDGGVTGSIIAQLPRPRAVDSVGPGKRDGKGERCET